MNTDILKKGELVLVKPKPANVQAGYFAGHEFQATVIQIWPAAVVVEDGDGDCFDCELDEVFKLDGE